MLCQKQITWLERKRISTFLRITWISFCVPSNYANYSSNLDSTEVAAVSVEFNKPALCTLANALELQKWNHLGEVYEYTVPVLNFLKWIWEFKRLTVWCPYKLLHSHPENSNSAYKVEFAAGKGLLIHRCLPHSVHLD